VKVIYSKEYLYGSIMDLDVVDVYMQAIVDELQGAVTFIEAVPATEEEIAAVHTRLHMEMVRSWGYYNIAALAAGGAIQAAEIGLHEPCFGLIQPSGHHAAAHSSWGCSYFNNMGIALAKLKRENRIAKAFILDFDFHLGDGTVNLLNHSEYVTVYNPASSNRNVYLKEVEKRLFSEEFDIIGVSAGFDNHVNNLGGLLTTEDYQVIGRTVREACARENKRYFALLEADPPGVCLRCRNSCIGDSKGPCAAVLKGDFDYTALGKNVRAFIEGMDVPVQPLIRPEPEPE